MMPDAPRSPPLDEIGNAAIEGPLAGQTVLEVGTRAGCAACGSLLSYAGATVFALEQPDDPASRPVRMAGKHSLALDAGSPDDLQLFDTVLARVDIVILSSDRATAWSERALARRRTETIVCDITAFGADGPLHGRDLSDPLLQALCGISSVTGNGNGAPVVSGAQVLELSTALYAATGVIVASRMRRLAGVAQDVEAALYDSAINLLVTFLPMHFGGKSPTRVGNRHPMSAPWNAYRAADGWVMLCSATDEHWRRVCDVIARPELAASGNLVTIAGRIAHCDDVDAAVTHWTRGRSVADAVAALSAAGLACGPILTMANLLGEANLVHRETVSQVQDPAGGGLALVPTSPLRTTPPLAAPPRAIPVPRSGRDAAGRLGPAAAPARSGPPAGSLADLPLAGVRVVEIGQYTTAPHAARQLALLGAEVIKVEPLEGEASRAWPPHLDGQGLFFTMNNSNKRSLALDLRRPADRDRFRELLATSDMLIENLKPGSLARLGFGRAEQLAINPRLIYCAISGFGAESVYPGRAAFDTVVQAMSGIMALTPSEEGPVKLGPSIADISGGIFCLFAALVLLEARDQTGRASALDLSMQDVAVWMTHASWNGAGAPAHVVIACRDGSVVAMTGQAQAGLVLDDDRRRSRAETLAALSARGIAAVEVLTIAEAAAHEQTVARGLIQSVTDAFGRSWPLFSRPYRLSGGAVPVVFPIGQLGEVNGETAQAGPAASRRA